MKDKRGRGNARSKRDGEGYRANKVNLVIGESIGSETSIYHYIIYWCY